MREYPQPIHHRAPVPGLIRFWQAILGIGLALLCLPRAQAAYDNCELKEGGSAFTTVAHAVGNFEITSAREDFLTDWIDIPTTAAWTCTRYTRDNAQRLEVILKPYMPPVLKAVFDHEGGRYSIYRSSPVPGDQVGYIMTRRWHIKSDSGYEVQSNWLPVNNTNHEGYHVDNHYLVLPHGATYTVSIESRVRLVKWTTTTVPATQFPRTGHAVEFEAVNWWWYRAQTGRIPGSPPVQSGTTPQRHDRVRVWFNRADKSCVTPSSAQTVRLAGVATSAFTGVGSVAGRVPFELTLNNCADTIAAIEYKLVPSYLETTHWPTTHANGMLTLSRHSTATGVRVQVLDDALTPVTFDRTTRVPVSGYTPGASTVSIPLYARYIQTAPAVTAGTVSATMTVLYMYK